MKRAALALALGLTLFAGRADAEETPATDERVVVLIYGSNDTFGIRLEAELRSIGLKVVRRRHPSRNQPDGTIAVVTISQRGDRRVEIRMGNDPTAQKAADVVVSVDDLGDDLQTIQAAERVRATFEPLAARPVPDAPPVVAIAKPDPPPLSPVPAPTISQPPPQSLPPQIVINVALPAPVETRPLVVPPLDPREGGWAFGFSAGVGSLFGSQGPSMAGTVSFVLSPFVGFRVEPFVMAPLVPLTLESGANRADVYAGAIGLRASYSVLYAGPFELALGGGAEGLWVRAVGTPAQGYVGTTEDAFTGAALFDLLPRFSLHDVVSLVPRGTVGLAFTPVGIAFDGQTMTTWGLPFAEASLAIELMWGRETNP